MQQQLGTGWTARIAYLDLKREEQDSVFLAGDGRSGTTWLAELINFDNSYRYMFEPFHPVLSRVAHGFEFFQYIAPDNDDEDLVSRAREVVTGRYRDRRVDGLNRQHLPRRRLIKDIFSNLLLRWLNVQFPQMPQVLIMRHPCAVAASKMGLSDRMWGVSPADFLRQPGLMADHLEPFRSLIEKTDDEFEKHILNWCLIHYVPLRQFHAGEIYLVSYEHLCESREYMIRQLFDFLGRDFHTQAIAASRRPSSTTTRGSAVFRDAELLAGWHAKIGREQRIRACEIMEIFGLEMYSDRPSPVIDDFNTCLQPHAY